MSKTIKINYNDTFGTTHSRNYYRGKSFHYAGEWAPNVHYTSDDYVIDFISINNTILACAKSHLSSSTNKPTEFVINDADSIVGVVSTYWDFVLSGKTGKDGKIFKPVYDNQTGILTWELVRSDEAPDELNFDLNLIDNINAAINEAHSAASDLLDIKRDANSAISEARQAATSASNAAGRANEVASLLQAILDLGIAQTTGQSTQIPMSQKAVTDSLETIANSIPTNLADLNEDTTHKLVTTTEKETWSGKQDAINDLEDIRSGANAGATAYQKPDGGVPKTDLASDVQTSLGKADTAIQDVKTINSENITGSGNIDLPRCIVVTDITTLTAEQLDLLRPSDYVVKATGTEKHTYAVTYKDETDGELSLCYFDHENVEEVYYEKQSDVWTYVVTDNVNILNKANKPVTSVNGHVATLTADGNLTDSGHALSEYLTTSTKYAKSISLTIDDSYKAVVDTTNKVPSVEGWYERSGVDPNFVYILSEDDVPDINKTYYIAPTWQLTAQLYDQSGSIIGTAQVVDLGLGSKVDKEYVDTQIEIASPTFRGTSAAGLTEQQFLAWANSLTFDANDCIYWQTVDGSNTIYKRYRYDGTNWLYEYDVNNSTFDNNQWAAINSGITSAKVTRLDSMPDIVILSEADYESISPDATKIYMIYEEE